MEIKLHDVYSFRYKPSYIEAHGDKRDLNWCFDGQLIVREDYNKNLVLYDTYWSPSPESKVFTLERAEEIGELTFKCNLDDVVECHKDDWRYFGKENIIDLSSQHGCYSKFVRPKNAIRKKECMKEWLEKQIKEQQSIIDNANWRIQLLREKQYQLDTEDLDKIYL